MWQLLPAIQIAKALAPTDLLTRGSDQNGQPCSLKRYAEASPAPISTSETLGSRWAFRDLLETGAAGS